MIEPTPVPRGETPLSDVADVPAATSKGSDEILLVVGGLEGAASAVDVDSFCDVGRLVLAGVAARLDFSLRTIERLQELLEELLRQEPEWSLVAIGFSCSDDELVLRAGPLGFAPRSRRRVERALEAAEVAWDESPHGVWASVRMSRPSLGRPTR